MPWDGLEQGGDRLPRRHRGEEAIIAVSGEGGCAHLMEGVDEEEEA